MATSGTYTFGTDFDISDVVEEAFEEAGLELRTGYDLVKARRSLNLLLTEWSNYQVNLWTLVETTQALTTDDHQYTLASDTVDILDAVIRDSNSPAIDTPIERISIEEFLNRPDKSANGRPTQFAVQKTQSDFELFIWPEPPDTTYSMIYWRMRYIQDVGDFNDNPDVPQRFLPPLVSGLAWKLACKNPAKVVTDPASGKMMQVDGVSNARRQELKQIYDEQFFAARGEDRDKASLWITPRVRRY